MLDILIDNKNQQCWSLNEIVTDVTWKTTRSAKAASLDLTYVDSGIYQDRKFTVNNGDIVRVMKDGQKLFYGYIFNRQWGSASEVKLTAYDQLRYLMSNDTYVFKNVKADEVIRKIASDFKLKTGHLEDTKHVIPTLVADNKKLLDIICQALDSTLMATGQYYMFYDDFGELGLRNIKDLLLKFAIGEDSLMYDYTYKKSIDNETYNRVKLVQDNKQTGKRDVYIVQHGANIAQWGLLQLYDKADEKLNAAQIQKMAENLLQLKNREQQKITIKALGDLRVRAGYTIYINLKEFGVKPFLIEECSHQFSGGEHTMTLELKVV